MYLVVVALLAFLCLSLAAPEYSIDEACNEVGFRDGIVSGVQQAIELADTAHLILNQFRQDEHVQSMCRAVLGDNNFDAKLDEVKEVYQRISHISRQPSPHNPFSKEWIDRKSNKDVSLWCSSARFVVIDRDEDWKAYHLIWDEERSWGTEPIQRTENECHNREFDPGERPTVKATTYSSDRVNAQHYRQDRRAGLNVRISDSRYRTEINAANDIDLCHWFIVRAGHERGWPQVDLALVSPATNPEFRQALPGNKRPIDTLRTFGVTMLHELSHTNQGLLRLDTDPELRGNVPSCYNWACITQLHDEKNADSIALLAVALKVWQLGYYVDREGDIHARR